MFPVRFFLGGALALALAWWACAWQAVAQSPAAVPGGFVAMDLPFGTADAAQVRQVLADLVQPGETYEINEARRVIRLTAKPATVEAIRPFLQALAAPALNVRIEVISQSAEPFAQTTGGLTGSGGFPVSGRVSVGGQGRMVGPPIPPGGGYVTPYGIVSPGGPGAPGVIRQSTVNGRPAGPMTTGVSGHIVAPQGGGEANLDVRLRHGTSSSLNASFILAASGGQGVLEVVREVPLLDYFSGYSVEANGPFVVQGPGNQIVQVMPGGQFRAPEFHWEKAGTRLLVKPTVSGNLISLEVVPQISAIVMGQPSPANSRPGSGFVTGASQYVTYTRLATTVVIENGATVTIGSFSHAPDDFSRQFFGTTGGSLTLRAVIQR